ncbi:MAG: bucentaur or craniofacial development-domain-containing protein [Benniella sp.]|nr:MAG: bucentaur or craniofacial development-domain-containing protein [Benniella sp.]
MAKPATERPPAKTRDTDSDSDSSDDEDYVPNEKADLQSDGEDSGSDDSEDEKNGRHDETLTADEVNTTRSGKRRSTGAANDPSKRHKAGHDSTSASSLAAESDRKNKMDALWAEFNAPAATRPSRPELLATAAAATMGVAGSDSGSGSGLGSGTVGGSQPAAGTKMVTITTTYEFAGETVTVTKDVPENSKEAMDAARKNGKAGDSTQPSKAEVEAAARATSASETSSLSSSAMPVSTTPSDSPSTPALDSSTADPASEDASSDPSSSATKASTATTSSTGPRVVTRPSILDSFAKKGPVRYVRKKSQLDELAATYGVKKPAKLNTLEKSKLDWNNFVGKEGIEDELKHHNKDGYMEKVAFLQRTDERRDREYQMLKKRK